jgi:hypothetical protein
MEDRFEELGHKTAQPILDETQLYHVLLRTGHGCQGCCKACG